MDTRGKLKTGSPRAYVSTNQSTNFMGFAKTQVKEKSDARRRMSVGGWLCIAMFIGLLVGVIVAYKIGNADTGFLFGMALMAFLPLAFLYALVEAIASRLRR